MKHNNSSWIEINGIRLDATIKEFKVELIDNNELDKQAFNTKVITQPKLTATFSGKLTPEGKDFLDSLDKFPDVCPQCDFTHEENLWIKEKDFFVCNNCKYILREKDVWHSIIE